MRRNLAAVLAADVVGYSRLMGEDAEGTLSALRRLRAELFGPAVAGHRGKVVKSMGDGWLVTFSSAAEAVECAMQVQDRLATDDLIKLRVGVHLGDIVHEEEDIFGDGINIAARLQEIAEPGSVVVSDAIYSSLDGVLRPSFDDAGERDLKNIALPVRVWTRGGEIAGAGLSQKEIAGFPRVSFIPVETSDQRAEVQELAAALTNDVSTYLSAIPWLQTRTSVTPEPDKYTLRCHLRARGERIRLETTFSGPDGLQLWSEKHDGDLNDSFEWQDEVGADLVTNVVGQTHDRETRILADLPEQSLSAEQLIFSVIAGSSMDADGIRANLARVDRAIELAPDWGFAYAIGLTMLVGARSIGVADRIPEYMAKYATWMERAETLEPVVSPVRLMIAFPKYVMTGDQNAIRSELEAMQRQLPFHPEVQGYGAWLHLYLGEPQAALVRFNRVSLVSKHTSYAHGFRAGRAGAYLQLGRYEEAIEEATAASQSNPAYPAPYRYLAAAYAHLGRMDEATAALATLEKLVPGDSISGIRTRSRYADTEGTRRMFEGLKMAGMAE